MHVVKFNRLFCLLHGRGLGSLHIFNRRKVEQDCRGALREDCLLGFCLAQGRFFLPLRLQSQGTDFVG